MAKSCIPGKSFEWSSPLAYAIGLLATDGCLSNDGRHIIMRSSEVAQLKTFKECLALKNIIGFTDGQRGYRVQFSNIQFYNWLIEIGLSPAKTYTIGKIKIPKKFFRDFIRGHFDGDGSVRFYKDEFNVYRGRKYRNNRLFVRLISASTKHMKWLQDSIKKYAHINGAFYASIPKEPDRVPIWTLKFSKKESVKFFQWIYYAKDIPALERKRLIAEKALSTIANEKRKKYEFLV